MFTFIRGWRERRLREAEADKQFARRWRELCELSLADARSRAYELIDSGNYFTSAPAKRDFDVEGAGLNQSLKELFSRFDSIGSPMGLEISTSLIRAEPGLPGLIRFGFDGEGYILARSDTELIYTVDPTRGELDVVYGTVYNWLVIDYFTASSAADTEPGTS
jgi:hypothetical protein